MLGHTPRRTRRMLPSAFSKIKVICFSSILLILSVWRHPLPPRLPFWHGSIVWFGLHVFWPLKMFWILLYGREQRVDLIVLYDRLSLQDGLCTAFQGFFSFHGLASGIELFRMDQDPRPFLLSCIPQFPYIFIVVLSEPSFQVRGMADINFTCGNTLKDVGPKRHIHHLNKKPNRRGLGFESKWLPGTDSNRRQGG